MSNWNNDCKLSYYNINRNHQVISLRISQNLLLCKTQLTSLYTFVISPVGWPAFLCIESNCIFRIYNLIYISSLSFQHLFLSNRKEHRNMTIPLLSSLENFVNRKKNLPDSMFARVTFR